MNEIANKFQPGNLVFSEKFGVGHVEIDKGPTVIVRFEHGYEECEKDILAVLLTPLQSLELKEWHRPLEVITKIQAEAIRSLNDSWGVFSRSLIALLPHQLWVCRRVNETWPIRWLVADDVGLGKTIEAGLILLPLISKGIVKRFLIICPASLVGQWQERLRKMFDIRTAPYFTQADTEMSDFWGTHNQVVASLQTIRLDRSGRHDRLFDSPPWDLLMVDEAHHLNADERSGPTLGYQIAERLEQENLVNSMVFFTGTPHRGKNYGFFSLLRLLRADLFDPRESMRVQLPNLQHVMIRNNKQNVTDLKGKRLFSPPNVSSETFTYSEEEERFYNMLTEFILTGQAYASSLDPNNQRTAMLVLITMQKLASSSVAAIRRAIRGRLSRIIDTRRQLEEARANRDQIKTRISEYLSAEQFGDTDRLAEIEDQIVELTGELRLMEDEEPRLRELFDMANEVKEETKINKILSIVEKKFKTRNILFFTEYKATQSLLMSALIKKYGDECVTFINGDNQAEDVIDSSGKSKTLRTDRYFASDQFNSGAIRFLVSTEAAGEGVDLQEECHTLIHVDLPWNPMRLHQRVGRLNRYGQKRQVDVISLRNPDTVESHIWDILNSKIENIMFALREVMEDPEDLFQLVLGMAPPAMFRELFTQARNVPRESLSSWFDQQTAHFGNKDVIDTVKDIVGHCSKFDFDQVSPKIPKVDLPDLKTFLISMLTLNTRRVTEDDNGLSFKTPGSWLNQPGLRATYENMVFDRKLKSRDAAKRVLGVGHKIIDQALNQALITQATLTTLPEDILEHPIIIFEIRDRVTTAEGAIKKVVAAVEIISLKEFSYKILKDWDLLIRLNDISDKRNVRKAQTALPPSNVKEIKKIIDQVNSIIDKSFNEFDHPFKYPVSYLMAILWPITKNIAE
jgi:superfamily II DNA or RNA helicase